MKSDATSKGMKKGKTKSEIMEGLERCPMLAELEVSYKSKRSREQRIPIRSSQDVDRFLRTIWNEKTLELVEEFYVICLNGSHEAIGWVRVSTGGLNSTSIDPRIIFGVALQTASTAIIVAHNHPSGSLEPSNQDKEVTKMLKEAGKLLKIKVLDHIILTKDSSFSFEEHGLM